MTFFGLKICDVYIFWASTYGLLFVSHKDALFYCFHLPEQHAFKNVNNSLNTNIYSYLETSDGQNCNLYLNVIHCFNTSVN